MSAVFNSFSTAAPAAPKFGLSEFMSTDSIIAKLAFLLLVVFLFILGMRFGISILSFFFSPNSPHLIDGMISAKEAMIFYQDPSANPFKAIPRSSNESDGIEFTWSTWIYVNNLSYLQGQYRHVFYKGNDDLKSNGLNFPNNAPGVYIAPNTNALVVMMNTYNEINKEVVIPDIPLGKWFNVIIRCQGKQMDVYINGITTRSVTFMGVPKQNDGNVYVATNGGFDGYISNLWYYNYALGVTDISALVARGPNTKMVGNEGSGINDKNADYLSLHWYIRG